MQSKNNTPLLPFVDSCRQYLVRLAVNHHLVSPRHQTALLLSWFFILLVASRFIVYKLNIKTRGYDGHDRDELTDEEATLRTEEFIRHIKVSWSKSKTFFKRSARSQDVMKAGQRYLFNQVSQY